MLFIPFNFVENCYICTTYKAKDSTVEELYNTVGFVGYGRDFHYDTK